MQASKKEQKFPMKSANTKIGEIAAIFGDLDSFGCPLISQTHNKLKSLTVHTTEKKTEFNSLNFDWRVI